MGYSGPGGGAAARRLDDSKRLSGAEHLLHADTHTPTHLYTEVEMSLICFYPAYLSGRFFAGFLGLFFTTVAFTRIDFDLPDCGVVGWKIVNRA